MKGKQDMTREKYSDWWKYDKRSKWNRHWAGKHLGLRCMVYSLAYMGYVCKECDVYMNYGDKERANILTYD